MFVLAALAPLLAVLSLLAAACDRSGPADPPYPETGCPAAPARGACAA